MTWIRQFVTETQRLTGRDPMVYTNTNWWNPCTGSGASFVNLPLDVSAWSGDPHPLPTGWNHYTLWQYTDNAPIGGMSSTTVDGNVFNGTPSDLEAYATGPVGVPSAPAANPSRVAVVDTQKDLYVKEGSLFEGWVHLAGNVSQYALHNTRVAVVTTDGGLYAKDDSLFSG